MKKEDYINMRDMIVVPIELYFLYFIDHGGNMHLEEFKKHFVPFIQKATFPYEMVTNTGKTVRIGFPAVINKIYSYYNKKFDL